MTHPEVRIAPPKARRAPAAAAARRSPPPRALGPRRRRRRSRAWRPLPPGSRPAPARARTRAISSAAPRPVVRLELELARLRSRRVRVVFVAPGARAAAVEPEAGERLHALCLAEARVGGERAVHGGERGGEPGGAAGFQVLPHEVRGVLEDGLQRSAVRAPRRVEVDEQNPVRGDHAVKRRGGDFVRDPRVAGVRVQVDGVFSFVFVALVAVRRRARARGVRGVLDAQVVAGAHGVLVQLLAGDVEAARAERVHHVHRGPLARQLGELEVDLERRSGSWSTTMSVRVPTVRSARVCATSSAANVAAATTLTTPPTTEPSASSDGSLA